VRARCIHRPCLWRWNAHDWRGSRKPPVERCWKYPPLGMLELTCGASAGCTEPARRCLSLRPSTSKFARSGMLESTIPAVTASAITAIDIVMGGRCWRRRSCRRTWLVLGYIKSEMDSKLSTGTYQERGLRLQD
jgi:hypothetical protein